jgi:hypothetical protein
MKIEEALHANIIPWREIEYKTKDYWAFADLGSSRLLFVPAEDTAEKLWKCYQAAYQFGFNGLNNKWPGFVVKHEVGEAAGQLVEYPHIHMIPTLSGE